MKAIPLKVIPTKAIPTKSIVYFFHQNPVQQKDSKKKVFQQIPFQQRDSNKRFSSKFLSNKRHSIEICFPQKPTILYSYNLTLILNKIILLIQFYIDDFTVVTQIWTREFIRANGLWPKPWKLKQTKRGVCNCFRKKINLYYHFVAQGRTLTAFSTSSLEIL